MGGKDSKLLVLTYEEAVKRVSHTELKRIRDAFNKYSSSNGLLPQNIFISEVLGETVPNSLAELIYAAFGGSSKGINFKELLCGLLLLTRGSIEEKCKFIFGLYAKDNGLIAKEDMISGTSQYADVWNIDHLTFLFDEGNMVNYDKFRAWLTEYPNATSLTQWLLSDPCPISLSNDLETPTFYQTLSGVTHLDEQEIIDLEKKYWQLKSLSPNGKFDLPLFLSLTSVLLNCNDGNQDNKEFCIPNGLFIAFDENCDGHLDFKEMVCGVSAACRGPYVERIKFCFKVFDCDHDGLLNHSEMTNMINSLNNLVLEKVIEENGESLLKLSDIATNESDSMTLEAFLIWGAKCESLKNLLNVLNQFCHVMLGLRPSSRIDEGELVLSWIRREEKRGYNVGDFWYLISSSWWKQWLDYVLHQEDLNKAHNASSLKNSVPDSGSDHSLLTRPGAIDNSHLLAPTQLKATVLTGEGGRLRKNLEQNKDYVVVPEPLWKALVSWYGANPPLPRQAIQEQESSSAELELYPLLLRLLRHSIPNNGGTLTRNGATQSWNTIVGGYGAAAFSGGYGYFPSAAQQTPRRYLAYTAAFSQLATVKQTYEYLCGRLRLKSDDVRLWHIKDDHCLTLLEDEEATLGSLGFRDNDQLLIEVRNKDLTWPEEMVSLSGQSGDKYRQSLPSEKGATGLNNLGNTCFMNASLQCVSNTQALTKYFASNMHLHELNRDNPLGMKGNIAKEYGDLVRDIWKGSSRTIAPLRLRWTIGKYAPRFNGYQQHDAQELLAFLLDGLHEDLNRVHDKPYVELSDSEGRRDVIVAQEAWENHLLRNRSIIVELFHGQLKSKVTCLVCQRESVRFDPFNYLSLPLPLESYVHVEVVVVRLDGSTPIKYGLRLPMDATYSLLKERLSALCNITPNYLLLTEVSGAVIKGFPEGNSKVRSTNGLPLFAYEVVSAVEPVNLPPNQSEWNEGNKFSDTTRAAKVFQMKGGHTTSEVRRPVGICMNVVSSMFCRKGHSVSANEESLPQRNHVDRQIVNGCEDKSEDISSLTSNSSNGTSSPVNTSNIWNISTDFNAHGIGVSFLIVYNRKMIRQDLYFVSPHKTRPSLFGLPLLAPLSWIPDTDDTSRFKLQTTCQDLYKCVWSLVSRLVSPSPPMDNGSLPNHAHDCDDSLGYEFPFTLKVVQSNGIHCGLCSWTKFCKGCSLLPSRTPLPTSFAYSSGTTHRSLGYCIAIDWEPTALHLRYQTSLEKVYDEDPSVREALQQQSEPVTLEQCLQAFTREEQLSGDEKYYCPKCATHQPASKKLQIWRLPPILIVHLKRFQFVNHRWVKSHKTVHFPYENLDLTDYLAAVPRETILRHRELKVEGGNSITMATEDSNNTEHSLDKHSKFHANGYPSHLNKTDLVRNNESTRKRLESTSLMAHPIRDEDLHDFHQHRLLRGYDKLDITYSLYAAVCHSGIMGGGHYISYAKNPNGKWFYYNDSTCKETGANQIEPQTAYMLFYERDGIDMEAYLPKFREPSTSSAESANSDLRAEKSISETEEEDMKKCSVM